MLFENRVLGFRVEETRGWRVGKIGDFIIGVVKLKQDYMIMTSDAKWEKRNGHKNFARRCKIKGLAGDSVTDEKRGLKYFLKISYDVHGGLFVSKVLMTYLLNNQRDATLSSRLFYSLRNYSTCFGCSLHPSSGVH
jgi:hypothetical protein